MTTWKEALDRGVWSLRSSSYDVGKFREAMAMMACSFLQVEEMYPDKKKQKALGAFLKEVIFSSARTQSVSLFRPIIRLE